MSGADLVTIAAAMPPGVASLLSLVTLLWVWRIDRRLAVLIAQLGLDRLERLGVGPKQ